MSFDQGEFNFDASGSDEGYRHWQQQLDQAKRKFEHRWGVILERPVCLQIRGYARPIEGRIHLISPPKGKDAKAIRLRIGNLDFNPNEIESISTLG